MNNDRFFSKPKGQVSPKRRRKCPWPDYAGNEIHEGDRIRLNDGREGVVEFYDQGLDPVKQWWINYGHSLKNWLVLKIGIRDQGVVVR